MTVFDRCTHALLCLSECTLLRLIEYKLVHEVLLALHELTLLFLSFQIEFHVPSACLLINQHVIEGGQIVLVTNLKGTYRVKKSQGVRGESDYSRLRNTVFWFVRVD